MKNKKGITLIALVITIIVMLILVGVAVNIAINGGLFETANDATRKMEEQTIYDQIVGVAKFETNGNIDVEETYSAIQTKFGEENVSELGQDGTFTVTGKQGTYTYILTRSKIDIYSANSVNADIAFLESFFMSEFSEEDLENAGIEIITEEEEWGIATYNGNTYKIEYDEVSERIVVSLYDTDITPTAAKAWGTSEQLLIKSSDDNFYMTSGNTVSTIASNNFTASLDEYRITNFNKTFSSDTNEIFNDSSVHMDLISIDTTAKYDFLMQNGTTPYFIYLPDSDSWHLVGTHTRAGTDYIYVFEDAVLNRYTGDISGALEQIEALNNGN